MKEVVNCAKYNEHESVHWISLNRVHWLIGISSLRRVLLIEVKVGCREEYLENEEASSVVKQQMKCNTERQCNVL